MDSAREEYADAEAAHVGAAVAATGPRQASAAVALAKKEGLL
jgi:hypothetical protein